MTSETVRRTVQISSHIGQSCDHCDKAVGGGWVDDVSLTESINHYITEHGYRLLYVGTETSHGDEGLWHSTVAVLGHDDPPALSPPSEVLTEFIDKIKNESTQG